MSSLGMKIKKLRVENGMKQTDLARELNVGGTTISNYETGYNTPDVFTLRKIARMFDVSIEYLLGDELVFDDPYKNISIKVPDPRKKIISVDVLGTVPAGIPFEAIEDVVGSEEIQISVAESSCDYFALRVKGDSMAPRIRSGDIVICKKQPSVESGEAAVVMVNGNDATLKRVKKSPEGITLVPDNPSFDVKYYSNEEIESLPIVVLGKVVELRGKI